MTDVKVEQIDKDAAKQDEVIRLTPEMLRAWAEWDPDDGPGDPLTGRQCGFVRSAFFAGWNAASRQGEPQP